MIWFRIRWFRWHFVFFSIPPFSVLLLSAHLAECAFCLKEASLFFVVFTRNWYNWRFLSWFLYLVSSLSSAIVVCSLIQCFIPSCSFVLCIFNQLFSGVWLVIYKSIVAPGLASEHLTCRKFHRKEATEASLLIVQDEKESWHWAIPIWMYSAVCFDFNTNYWISNLSLRIQCVRTSGARLMRF